MASGIPTRRTRRADENAPPAIRTRSSASILSQTAHIRATETASHSEPSSRSSIPVMKRQASSLAVDSKARSALGEVTNAGKAKGTTTLGKGKEKEKTTVMERKPLTSTAAPQQGALATRRAKSFVDAKPKTGLVEADKPPKRKATTASIANTRPTATRSRSTTASASTGHSATHSDVKPLAERRVNVKVKEGKAEPARKRRKTSTPPLVEDDLADEGQYDEDGKEILLSSGGKAVGMKSPKRVGAKDEGWEDLDAEDEGDPTMVSEYVIDAFRYMMSLEQKTMPDPLYMDAQAELQWKMRTILMDWLIEVHSKFRLLPETLFIAVNLIDRFLSARVISLVKFQLVGLTALFVAAKYEEVICPSVTHFLHMTDGGYGVEEILKAERYMLSTIEFDLSYPNPLHFLRRISKADGYDIQARTVGKFLVEISALDHKLLPYSPSLLAAAAMWLARLCLERGPWTPNLVHYSSYSVEELLEPAQIMLDFLLDLHFDTTTSFYKKYAGKKHMKASVFMHAWAVGRWPYSVTGDAEEMGMELYIEAGVTPPESRLAPGDSKAAQAAAAKESTM